MKSNNGEEIKNGIKRSQKSLKAAKKLLEEELLEDSISRAYYSVLHAVKAVLLSENVSANSHEGIKRLFGKHFIKTGKMEVKYSKILRQEQDERLQADYDTAFSPEIDQVQKRIEDAGIFLEKMTEYLLQEGINIEEE